VCVCVCVCLCACMCVEVCVHARSCVQEVRGGWGGEGERAYEREREGKYECVWGGRG